MIEILVTIAISLIVAGMAVLSLQGSLPGMRVNAGLNQVVSQMRTGRESAIAQRRNFQLTLAGANQIQLHRLEIPTGVTDFPPVTMDNNVQFTLFAGLPDTPDGFGNATAIAFGGSPTLQFNSDGTFTDAVGVPLNGTVFIGIPGQPATARAVTVLGTTGRVRPFHWTGSQWID